MEEEKIIELRKVTLAEPSNDTFDLQNLASEYPEFEVVPRGKFYPYSCVHNDSGWGCAWRSIQLMLSSRNIQTDFNELFQKYSRKKVLLETLKKRLPHLDLPEIINHKWSPEQNEKNWAEPFIGQLISESYSIKTKLILLEGKPEAFAPQSVFEEVIGFPAFRELIKKVIPESPIMIDDGIICLSIVGYHEQADNKFSIIFADPHIESNIIYKKTGIYKKVFNEQGKALQTIMEKEEEQNMRGSQVSVYFENKKWMVMYFIDE